MSAPNVTLHPPAQNLEPCTRGHACSFCPDEPECQRDKPGHDRELIASRLAVIDRIVLVLGNKGGVGKSTVAANLAAALAQEGHRVGLGDADIHGPNAGVFFGCQSARVKVGPAGIRPVEFRSSDGAAALTLGSLAMLLPEPDSPVVWRDAYKFDFIHHLVGSFDWGPLDYWVLDMPPGTGNELITMCDLIEDTEATALLVTTTQAVALHDSLKAARFCRERGLPMLGWVANMAGLVCPHCAGEIELFPRSEMSEQLTAAGVERLAEVPVSLRLASASDAGQSVVFSAPDSLEARIFTDLAQRLAP
ncbi:P-loop NTPase [Rhabdochromatium marinum]|uniref:P-loop NTPase n=1 Tax=Rhabdochromatium marinum TaxID=48729 RepID=UPI0019075D5D|nr:P-loop NTPase [Rhabdochromatium marinum]MBK1650262.1 chromosome partitioning protein ParA [Rhabdochromatium marinum]